MSLRDKILLGSGIALDSEVKTLDSFTKSLDTSVQSLDTSFNTLDAFTKSISVDGMTINNSTGSIEGIGAGYHNKPRASGYKCLGSVITDKQHYAIEDKSFDDLFVGDYWTIGGRNYRIVHNNYYFNTGDTACTTPHCVIVPDTNLYTHCMNDTNITTGGYVGSKMYTEGLTQAQEIINSVIAKYIKNGQISAEDLKKLSEMGYSVHDINKTLNTVRSLGVNRDNLQPSGEHSQRKQTLQELANDLFKKLGF